MTGRRKAKGVLKDRDNNRHVDVKIYILNEVCRKYAEGMQCKSLTLPYS